MNANTLLIKNGLVVTVNNKNETFIGDILVNDNKIVKIKKNIKTNGANVFDATDYIIIPGLIQTHIHLCQTLFRNLADDLSLMDWLNQKIWPFEGLHTAETLRISTQMGIAELFMGGTSTILDMGTINHMDVVFEELVKSGIRAYSGKTMMDYGNIPQILLEDTKESINNSIQLFEKWHNSANGRIKYAFAPRFVVSCTKELLAETAKFARKYDTLFHTHASETRQEVEMVEQIHNDRNISLLEKIGVTAPNLCLAHCIWLDEKEKNILQKENIKVLHCPGSNLKLGSGIAPIPDYLDRGISVSIGADGAPCNNNLDMFNEMRLAALIQKPAYGPKAMDAETVFKMATIEGARALKLDHEVGSIEEGKLADFAFVKLNQVQTIPYENIYSKLVYATNSNAVEHLLIDGKWVMQNRMLIKYDIDDIIRQANILGNRFKN